MKSKIYYLIYISTATRPFSKNDLLELLAKSRENNRQLGVTGMLLYKSGSFQQILEGPQEVVRPLFEKIKLDPRHRGVLQAIEGYADEREFADWSMGFCDLDSAEAAAVPGYSPFLNTPLTDEQFISNPSTCRLMMSLFKESTRS